MHTPRNSLGTFPEALFFFGTFVDARAWRPGELDLPIVVSFRLGL